MDLDTSRLRAFLQVAERGTVAAAARAMGYTAPAVSQQITKLEAQLGSSLFDRVGGRLRLNARGEGLVPIARQVLDLTRQVEHDPSALDRHRHVVIAGFASAISALVIPLLRTSLDPPTTFEIREAEDESALRDLGLGQIDIALVQEYDGAPVARVERFDYTPLLTDRLRLLVPPSFSASVRLDDLATERWLLNGDGTRCEQATHQILTAAGITPRVAGHVADNATLLALVAAGHGVTIAPELVIAGAAAGLTVASAELGVRRRILGVTRTAATDLHADLLDQLAANDPGAR
jgi:DNA-binding transcriptional LysR family regulator